MNCVPYSRQFENNRTFPIKANLKLQGDKTRAKQNSKTLSKTSTELGAEIKEEEVK
jgi:hypothetical protein